MYERVYIYVIKRYIELSNRDATKTLPPYLMYILRVITLKSTTNGFLAFFSFLYNFVRSEMFSVFLIKHITSVFGYMTNPYFSYIDSIWPCMVSIVTLSKMCYIVFVCNTVIPYSTSNFDF